MKKHSSEHLYHAAQQMLLPAEIIGASRIEITGCSQILLSGHKGIRRYGEEEIIVDLRDCAADIQGSGLHIISMTQTELLIGGEPERVCLIR